MRKIDKNTEERKMGTTDLENKFRSTRRFVRTEIQKLRNCPSKIERNIHPEDIHSGNKSMVKVI